MPEAPRSIHADSRELCLKINLKPAQTVSYMLSDRIRGLFQTCQFFDMFVTVGNARFPCHQAVLAASSDWLRSNLNLGSC